MVGDITVVPAGRTFDQLIAEFHAQAEALNRIPVSPPAGLVEHVGYGAGGLTIGPTFREIVDRYVDEIIEPQYSAGHIQGVKSTLNLYIYPAFGDRPLLHIRRQDIRKLLNEILKAPNCRFPKRKGCPERANWAYWFLGRFFVWCIDEELLEVSPMYGVKRPAPNAERERVLTDNEIRLFWAATAEVKHPYGIIARLLLVTGVRKSEIANVTQVQIDREARMLSIPVMKTKARRSHLVPLSDMAFDLLTSVSWLPNRPLIFAHDGIKPLGNMSFRRANLRIHKRMIELYRAEKLRDGRDPDEAHIEWFVFHDLRRTAATRMCKLGFPVEVVDKALNHAGAIGARRGNSVTKVYVKYEFLEERGAALQALADHVATLVGV